MPLNLKPRIMKSSLLILAGFLTICCSTLGIEHALWKSADGGRSWKRLSKTFSNRINAVQISSRGLLAATDKGLFLSGDTGRTWIQTATVALQSARILCLDSLGEKTVIGTRDRGVWLSHDDGHSSTRVEGLSAGHIRALAHSDSMVFAGSNDGKVFVSADQARSWRLAINGLPEDAQIFQLSVSRAGQVYAALYSKGLYVLRKDRWERLGDVTPLVIAVNKSRVFVGHNPGGVFKSSDSGATWRPVQNGLPFNAPSWVLYAHGQDVFYGTTGLSGLYKSSDGGESWRPVDVRSFRGQAVVALAAHGSFMIAATVSEKQKENLLSDPLFPIFNE